MEKDNIVDNKNIVNFKMHEKFIEKDGEIIERDLDPFVFRYVVPFYFKSEFEEAFKCIENDVNWTRKINNDNKTEIDLFDYLKDEYVFDEKIDANKTKQGCEWTLQNCEKNLVFNNYVNNAINYSLDFKISDGGLYLFKNKIGFLWYELKADFDSVKEDIGLTTVMLEFQHKIKELNRNSYFLSLEKDTGCFFSFGTWINTLLKPLDDITFDFKNDNEKHNITYFAQRKTIDQYKTIYDFAIETLDEDKITFKNDFEYEPDKALLFCYACFKEEKVSYEDQKLFAFRLANGNDNLKLSEQGSYIAEKPFDDTIWYASQEGSSIVSWSNNSFTFLPNKKADRIRYAYFKLFIKAIYQSYSLSVFSNRIHKDIPIINKDNIDKETGEKIFDLYWDVNNFLAKSTSTSVSYMDSHTLYYVYLKKQLRIVEDINSITAGLEAINNLQKEILQEKHKEEAKKRDEEAKKRAEKTSALMGLLTLFNLGPGLDGVKLFMRNIFNIFSELFAFNNKIITEDIVNVSATIIWFIITFIAILLTVTACYKAFFLESAKKKKRNN